MEKYLIKDLIPNDRPRERLLANGAEALSNTELLAILIGTGTKNCSALDLARKLLGKERSLWELARFTKAAQLTRLSGMGPAKTAVILAALEIGKRIAQSDSMELKGISSAEEAAEFLMPRLRYEAIEHFVVVLLSSKNKVLGIKQISQGSLNSTVVHPREVFSPAVEQHAAAIIVGHNHPSGDPAPSGTDKSLTELLVNAGQVLGIPLLDHVIIGDGRFYSFKDAGLI